MNSLKALIQSQPNSGADAPKKQWLGFLLISQLFDPTICIIDALVFTKNINIFINAISNTVSKNEIFSDISIIAINAWRGVLKMLAKYYD